ncbi:hypothetical protein KA183_20845, partial [bacterium]|nr:hypothetical protein [bacterium]
RRIKAAVEDFEEGNQPFSTRDLAIKSGVSRQTLYKHHELWKKAQENLQKSQENGCLETGPHKYNAGVGVASFESNPLPFSEEQSIPLGLLAARRIAYEIRMREEKRKRLERRAFILTREVSAKEWRDRVASILKKDGENLCLNETGTITVLKHLLLTAPTLEDGIYLELEIRKKTNL